MSGTPILLAIESSQRRGGIAVRDHDGKDHVEWLGASARHDDDLLAAVDRMYTRLGLAPADTGVVGVSTGPGGFTGLRVAVATAKMLAESLGAQLVAVPTALVVAERQGGPGPITVALASKEGSVWETRLVRAGNDAPWTVEQPGGLTAAGRVRVEGLMALLGDQYLPQELRQRCAAAGVVVVEPIFDPVACLLVTSRLFEQGRTIDPLAIAPIYSRPPAAVATSDRDRYRP
jgi:tRNA threonylcarbamoyl adenosine modification protein YeaZ